MCVSGDPRYRDENELVNRILYYVFFGQTRRVSRTALDPVGEGTVPCEWSVRPHRAPTTRTVQYSIV